VAAVFRQANDGERYARGQAQAVRSRRQAPERNEPGRHMGRALVANRCRESSSMSGRTGPGQDRTPDNPPCRTRPGQKPDKGRCRTRAEHEVRTPDGQDISIGNVRVRLSGACVTSRIDRIGGQSEHLHPVMLAITKRTHPFRGVRIVRHDWLGREPRRRLPAMQRRTE
jgi:hypothetical protein